MLEGFLGYRGFKGLRMVETQSQALKSVVWLGGFGFEALHVEGTNWKPSVSPGSKPLGGKQTPKIQLV